MKLRCPLCRQAFPWEANTPFPDNCLKCKQFIGHNRDDDDIVMPFVRSNGRSASVDQVYRDMEAGSEVRAQAAADMAGVPVSEMSGLKITNLNDRKDAEIAAPALTGSAAQLSAMMQSNPAMGMQAAPPQFAGGGAGNVMRGLTVASHQETATRNGLPAPPSWDISSVQPKRQT